MLGLGGIKINWEARAHVRDGIMHCDGCVMSLSMHVYSLLLWDCRQVPAVTNCSASGAMHVQLICTLLCRWDVDAASTLSGDLLPRFSGCLAAVGHFDAAAFGISRSEAAAMDPQQRLLLERTAEAAASSGGASVPTAVTRDTNVGVFLGLSSTEYAGLTAALAPDVTAFTATGVHDGQPEIASQRCLNARNNTQIWRLTAAELCTLRCSRRVHVWLEIFRTHHGSACRRNEQRGMWPHSICFRLDRPGADH